MVSSLDRLHHPDLIRNKWDRVPGIYPWMVCPRMMHWCLRSYWSGRKGPSYALGLGYRRWKSRRPWGAPHGVNTWLEHYYYYYYYYYVLFAQARVHCDNKPRQIGLNHNYNMTFLISPHGCPYSPLKWRSSRSKQEPFRVLLPLLLHVAPLSDGKLLSHNAVVKGHSKGGSAHAHRTRRSLRRLPQFGRFATDSELSATCKLTILFVIHSWFGNCSRILRSPTFLDFTIINSSLELVWQNSNMAPLPTGSLVFAWGARESVSVLELSFQCSLVLSVSSWRHKSSSLRRVPSFALRAAAKQPPHGHEHAHIPSDSLAACQVYCPHGGTLARPQPCLATYSGYHLWRYGHYPENSQSGTMLTSAFTE